MILTDSGPLIAITDEDDSHHRVTIQALRSLPSEHLLTTMPGFTEAMYLLHRLSGHQGQTALWEFYESGWLLLH